MTEPGQRQAVIYCRVSSSKQGSAARTRHGNLTNEKRGGVIVDDKSEVARAVRMGIELARSGTERPPAQNNLKGRGR